MDKSSIKTYAVEARRKLMEAVKLKARQLYIFEDGALPPDVANPRLKADGVFLTPEQEKARLRICNTLAIYGEGVDNTVAYQRLVEEVACTWFNRLIALRIMEVNDWLPSNIRILSSREQGRIEPDAVREVERLDYISQSKIAELRADTALNATEKLYKYILISQCNALSAILPGMFEEENDYTELLLPDALLAKGGIVNDLVTHVHEDNFNIEKQGQIEIIGWLYQFYISEKKDEVFAGLKKNIKINKDTIPAATQLFTPEWIVKYMVENSLGRLWLDVHPNEELRAKWKYYVDEAEQEPEVAEQLRLLRSQSPVKRPEDIKLIDPCMGSGHILVYAFDVLFQIYQSEGYSEREIPNLILQHNLHGLDIDDRAGQLAYFALMIKARSYNRRFFRQDSIPQPKVYAVPEIKVDINGLEKWLGMGMSESDRKAAFEDLRYLASLFKKGKEYGSLLKIEREIDFERLRKYIQDQKMEQMTIEETGFTQADNLDHLLDVAIVLSGKYDVAVANPPYMAPAPAQADWITKNYPNSKSDLCVVFIERNFDLLKRSGYLSMITMHSWMFLSSFEKFREKLIATKDIVNMVHLGARAFEEIGGEVVQTTVFVGRSTSVSDYVAIYSRLVEHNGQQVKENAFLSKSNYYAARKENFTRIPGSPVAYWVSGSFFAAFENGESFNGDTKKGVLTGNDAVFTRYWFEVSNTKIGFTCYSHKDMLESRMKWFPKTGGGAMRKWYGNFEDIVNLENDGAVIKATVQNYRLRESTYYMREAITWTEVAMGSFSSRYVPRGILFGNGGPVCFFGNRLFYTLGVLNSKVCVAFLKVIAPTINYGPEQISKLPIIFKNVEEIERIVKNNISISRTDWDSFEASWDFQTHPLVLYKNASYTRNLNQEPQSYVKASYESWESDTEQRFTTLKANEEELNRIFIDIYGLQDELTPEVEEKDVTVRRADLGRDIRSFLSYAVGCMFGRYSLDAPGLAFAGGTFDMAKYKTFLPEDDNILPIGSADYFDDDIVIRFVEFVRTVYGEDTLGQNLDFIANALYPNSGGTAQERIRRYFLNDFYKDHVKIYQKCPIYWLLDSGKKDGFKALFYLHRYDKYTIARARTDYLHPLQRKYEAEIKRLETLSNATDNAREKATYRKEVDLLLGKIAECRTYDQVIAHIAHQQIELDLDDGVKVNYAKFQGVEVPKDNGKTETMDLLAKI